MKRLNPKPVLPSLTGCPRLRARLLTGAGVQPVLAVASFALALSSCDEGWGDSCFTAGTLVDTPHGPRRIESLRVGDEVLSYSLRLQSLVIRRIRATLHGVSRIVGEVRRAGRLLAVASPSHPFFAASTGSFNAVAELGDGATFLALSADGSVSPRGHRVLPIDGASRFHQVYNLSVDGEENYFAGSLLVHNKSGDRDGYGGSAGYASATGYGGSDNGLVPDVGGGGRSEDGGATAPIPDAAAVSPPPIDAAPVDLDAASPDAELPDATSGDGSPLDAASPAAN
jgi:hypothetical protein